MKKPICILALLTAAAESFAATAWVNASARQIWWHSKPEIIVVEGRKVSLPTDAALADSGWTAIEYDCHPTDAVLDYDAVPPIRCMTPAELEAREAQRQADQAAAEAAATLPATFPTGIAVTNEAGHWVEFIPDGTNVVCETLAIQISHSPLTPEQRNQMRQDAVATREAKRAEAKAAKKNGKLQDRIAALEALLGVE